jgi:aquaporin Z
MLDTVALLSEYFGTFLLLLTILASGGNALATGASLALIMFLIGRKSGAHVNPAVSVAMYMRGSLGFEELLGYIMVQVLGAVSSLYVYRSFA